MAAWSRSPTDVRPMNDHVWDVSAYEAFSDLRLRPALDLLARVPKPPRGEVVDLGCGSGAVAATLRGRFPESRLVGVDASADMLRKAGESAAYDELIEADIAGWTPDAPPALIFSNAALHWLGDHETLIPRLYAALASGGVLAIQMPGQLTRPSHETMIEAAASIRPELFEGWRPFPGPRPLPDYAALLPTGRIDLWETEYWQALAPSPDGAHPVRAFVSSTGARPILSRLDDAETSRFADAWDDALEEAYPRRPDGGCWFPFRRVFIVAERTG